MFQFILNIAHDILEHPIPTESSIFPSNFIFLSADRGVDEAYGRQTLKFVKEIPSFWVMKPCNMKSVKRKMRSAEVEGLYFVGYDCIGFSSAIFIGVGSSVCKTI